MTSLIFTDLSEVPIDLYEPTNNKVPRYSIHILDQKPNRENGKYAAFIVPQGRLVNLIFLSFDMKKCNKFIFSKFLEKLNGCFQHNRDVESC